MLYFGGFFLREGARYRYFQLGLLGSRLPEQLSDQLIHNQNLEHLSPSCGFNPKPDSDHLRIPLLQCLSLCNVGWNFTDESLYAINKLSPPPHLRMLSLSECYKRDILD